MYFDTNEYPNIFVSRKWHERISEYIRMNFFDTNEYPVGQSVSPKRIRKTYMFSLNYPIQRENQWKYFGLNFFWPEAYPAKTFFKPSVPGDLRVFRAFASLFYFKSLVSPWRGHQLKSLFKAFFSAWSIFSNGRKSALTENWWK